MVFLKKRVLLKENVIEKNSVKKDYKLINCNLLLFTIQMKWELMTSVSWAHEMCEMENHLLCGWCDKKVIQNITFPI